MRRKGAVLLALLLGALSAPAGADEVRLNNGDRLSGTVLRLEEGVLVLRTDYSPPVEIRREHVTALRTEGPVSVHLAGGEVLRGALGTAADGRAVVGGGPGRSEALVAWGEIRAINPPPAEPPRWHGKATVGGNRQTGNTDRSSVTVGFDSARKSADDRFSLRFLHNYAEEEGAVSARNTYGMFKYDYFFTRRFFGYLGVELLADRFRDLNLRTVVGPGLGYQVWEEERRSLALEAGVAYFNEDLDEGEDRSWVTGRLALDFSWRLGGDLVFTENLVAYPSLERGGEYQLRNEAGFSTPLSARWSLLLRHILERDSEPAPGVRKNDYYWILGLQYGF